MTWHPHPTVAARLGGLLAEVQSGTDLPSTIFVKPKPELLRDIGGQKFAVVSELQLDTDGWPEGEGKDPDWQKDTSIRYLDNSSLNANEVPFFVLPGRWYAKRGAGLGDFGVFLFKDRIAFAVFGDEGPAKKIGEGSVELLRQLGFERVRPNGDLINAGTDPGVVTIVFCGSALADYADQPSLLDAIATTGRQLFIDAGGKPDA